jgi:hypothetical protein
MSAINGRVARLERMYGAHRAPEGEHAALLRRVEEVLHLVPTPALELLRDGCVAGQVGEPMTPEQRAARKQFDTLLETGEWPR